MLKIQNALLTTTYLPSPHCDHRPDADDISLIVVHNISLPPAQFGTGSVEKFFCGNLNFNEHPYFETIKELRVSAHLLIHRNGDVTQFVPFDRRAWHAGKSFFQGRENCNDFSIGIELEGTDDIPFEKKQYARLAEIIQLLQEKYPKITREHIVGHSDIAPGRKTDPGPAFDWSYLDCLLNP